MPRKNIAAGNWKMNLSLKEGLSLAKSLVKRKRDHNTHVILGVPALYISEVQNMVRHIGRVEVAAQNCHEKESGAYTGEISATMLSSMNVKYVILGHSERRAYFNESNLLLKTKVDTALANGLKVIFCCGESLDIRKKKKHVDHVKTQLKESLFHLTSSQMKNIVIAYEPIWAIGTGETASPAQAQEMHQEIRKSLNAKYGKLANDISILYGGSVKPANAKELFAMPDIDGGLVGGASLKANIFGQIINSF
jgi:triosephosphate isomerase